MTNSLAIQKSRLSPAMRLNLAYVHAAKGDIAAAESHVAAAYAESPDVKDGYARCAWQFFAIKKTYPELGRQEFTSIQDCRQALSWIKRDLESDRLSPQGVLFYAMAVAKIDGMEAVSSLIENLYNESPEVKNAWSQVAWFMFVPQVNAYKATLPFFEKDVQLGRLYGDWLLNYALAVACVGNMAEAEDIILKSYAADGSLLNGFSRCAWGYYWPRKQFHKVIEWMERDLVDVIKRPEESGVNTKSGMENQLSAGHTSFVIKPIKRMSASYRINLAQAYAAIGEIDKAEKYVESAYADSLIVKDGYSRIAWQYFWPRKEYEKVFEIMSRDLKSIIKESGGWVVSDDVSAFARSDVSAPSLSPGILVNMACAYAAKGCLDRAESLIEIAYSESPVVQDGYSRAAWSFFWPLKSYDKVIEWMERDLESGRTHKRKDEVVSGNELNRLSPAWRVNLAHALAAKGDIAAAESHVAAAYAESKGLEDGYSKIAWSWFVPYHDNFHGVLKYIEKDCKAERITAPWLINKAVALAASGRFEEALLIIEKVYSAQAKVKNGYSRIAWQCYVHPNRACFDKAEEWFEKDVELNRLADDYVRLYVAILASVGKIKKAEQFIEKAKKANPKSCNLYVTLACNAFSHRCINIEDACCFVAEDGDAGLINETGYPLKYAILSAAGKWREVKNELCSFEFSSRLSRYSLSHAAWFAVRFAPDTISVTEAIESISSDLARCNKAASWEMVLAVLKSRAGETEQAVQMADEVYERNYSVYNAYSSIALADMDFLQKISEYFPLFERDYKTGRMSAGMKLVWSFFLRGFDDDKSRSLCREAFDESAMATVSAINCAPFISGFQKAIEGVNLECSS